MHSFFLVLYGIHDMAGNAEGVLNLSPVNGERGNLDPTIALNEGKEEACNP